MDQNLRKDILEELLRRLGEHEQFERLATRANVPIIVMPGASVERRYEQLIDRLWQNGAATLAGYLEVAAQEAGGGFEMRHSLGGSSPSGGGWEGSQVHTAMIMLPPPDDPVWNEVAEARPSPFVPRGAQASGPFVAVAAAEGSRPNATLVVEPPKAAEPVKTPEPVKAPELETMEKNRARRQESVQPPPVGELDKPAQDSGVSERLRTLAAEPGSSAARMDGPTDDKPLALREARFVANIAGDGTRGGLHLIGSGFRAPLFLELEGLPGARVIERVKESEAYALLAERDRIELMNGRVRLVRGGTASGWVQVQTGGRENVGDPWPVFRPDTGYVPAGEYVLPGETTRRRLEQGVQLGLNPVTNREMITFVQHTGYVPELIDGFLKHYRADAVPEHFWEHPAIFVNRADAEAYCKWVGGKLPSVEAWERAAVGLTGREYPWGGAFDLNRLNSRESRRGWTSPARGFPEGRGPYGHFNLAGNVWEWTATPAHDSDHVILKGGAWVNDRRCASNSYRAVHRQELRAFYIGFRVAFDLPPGVIL